MKRPLDHTADVGYELTADSFEDLVAEGVHALFEVIAGPAARVEPRVRKRFRIAGDEPGWLLIDALRELLAAHALEGFLAGDCRASRFRDGLVVECVGEPYDSARHPLAHEVKGVTLQGAAARKTPTGWEATVLFDV